MPLHRQSVKRRLLFRAQPKLWGFPMKRMCRLLWMKYVKALHKAQKAFEGVAEQMGVYNEDDVQALVDEVRYGKGKE